MRPIELVEAPPLDAAGHMGLDEAILSLLPKGKTLLRFYRWSNQAVTFGYSQPYAYAVEQAKTRGMGGGDIVRRPSGGGVVFHDGDLTFSLVFPWERLSSPSVIYKDLHRGVHLGLKHVHIPTRLWSPAKAVSTGSALEKACFGGVPEPMDLVREDGIKVLGGALRRRGTMGLYQGSFRVDVLAAAVSVVRAAIVDGLARELGHLPDLELDARWLQEGELLAEKYRSDRWNRRR
jgi:lipoate-protein ligase A